MRPQARRAIGEKPLRPIVIGLRSPSGHKWPPLRMERRMSDTEAVMWLVERDPIMRSAFSLVTLLDQAPDVERFKRRMAKAVVANYAPTAKNKPCLSFWQSSGFSNEHDRRFTWDLARLYPLPEAIALDWRK